MKSFSRTLTLPLMIAALTGCGGSSGSDNGNEISQSGEIVNLLTGGLSRLRFSNDYGVERSPLIRFETRLENSTVLTTTQLFNGSTWDDISDENVYNRVLWNGSQWVIGIDDNTCSVQPAQTSGKLTVSCSTDATANISATGTPLEGVSIKAVLQDILIEDEDDLSEENFNAVTAAIEDVTATFSANARSYQMRHEYTTHYVEVDCNVEEVTAGTSINELNCDGEINASSFEGVFNSDITFLMETETSPGEYDNESVYLVRNEQESTGDIKLKINDEVLGQWELVNLSNDFTIVKMTLLNSFLNDYNALVLFRDSVYLGTFSPAGSTRIYDDNYNAAAIAEIVAVLEGKAPFVPTQQ